MAQYNKLMELLNKASQSLNDTSTHALMAGKFCLWADNYSKSDWFINSGQMITSVQI